MHRLCPYHVPRDFPVRHGVETKRTGENKHVVIEQRQLRRLWSFGLGYLRRVLKKNPYLF
jgi:hypothetical protein